MPIVLLKAPDACQPRQRPAKFIAMQHAKVAHAQGELAVAALAMRKHDAVTGAVHGLEGKCLVFAFKTKHVFLERGSADT